MSNIIKGVAHRFKAATSGNVEIRINVISTMDARRYNIGNSHKEIGSFYNVQAGTYVAMLVDGEVMMSDTHMERNTNQKFVDNAKGDVLIAGLGIGMVLPPLFAKTEVTSVTVIELNKHVIKLVKPKYRNKKLKVVQADIMEWEPPQKYDTIYFDIWPTISGDNVPQMKELHTRYRPYLNKKGYMDSWCKRRMEAMNRRDNDYSAILGGDVRKLMANLEGVEL